MRLTFLAAALAAAVVFTGCGGDVPRGRVHGTLKLNGQPLAGTTVIFLAKDNKTHVADLKADGSYEVSGVALGPVKVSVQAPAARSAVKDENTPRRDPAKDAGDEKAGREPPRPPEPKVGTPALDARYGDANKSGLTFELTQADQEWSVDLK